MSLYAFKVASLSCLLSLAAVNAAPADGGKGGVSPFNKLGTSLVDYTDCKKVNGIDQKDYINKAYKEAHTIINLDGVKNKIAWDSVAAEDFFGPAQFNKDQQGQIQAVLANVETMQPGWFFNPFGHSLQVRCDDPKKNCGSGVTAYTVNPSGNEKPYITFCPSFFRKMSLDDAVKSYKDSDNPEIKWNVDGYMNRGLIFLHELFHLDLAADSEKGEPNPKIYDIYITYYDSRRNGEISRPTKAYEARLSKLLARFLPKEPTKKKPNPKSTGWWVQRNVDNFSRYAMAHYLQDKIGGYPFMPFIYDELRDPLTPDPRPGKTSLIGFQADNGTAAVKLTMDKSDASDQNEDGDVNVDSTHTTDEVFEVGKPIPLDAYSDAYRKAYGEWVDALKGKSDGKCKLEVEEIWTCEDVASNLYASVKITDNGGKVVYTTPGSAHSPGQPINDGHALQINEKGMAKTLTLVGEHTNDYIQFSYGDKSWTSNDDKGDATCKLVGDNWDKDGPKGCPNAKAVVRNFGCQYPCEK
ncbi:hypothetical protein QQS21_003567 [Conoideocrella luteorostrata]|uniref:Uncharacterized protein n=1 Tax=Conoideocrella luteorostrata TaxID=1105319 RepID=A0AAJ0G0I1_9HYPO|nr:hypothetical protein QQS21_003567 [Conoideocrella luteorostrata]